MPVADAVRSVQLARQRRVQTEFPFISSSAISGAHPFMRARGGRAPTARVRRRGGQGDLLAALRCPWQQAGTRPTGVACSLHALTLSCPASCCYPAWAVRTPLRGVADCTSSPLRGLPSVATAVAGWRSLHQQHCARGCHWLAQGGRAGCSRLPRQASRAPASHGRSSREASRLLSQHLRDTEGWPGQGRPLVRSALARGSPSPREPGVSWPCRRLRRVAVWLRPRPPPSPRARCERGPSREPAGLLQSDDLVQSWPVSYIQPLPSPPLPSPAPLPPETSGGGDSVVGTKE